uniref:acyl-ACP desaturase n=1 Tax=Sphingopyxis terrae TaxID=33052 RepID=UPI0036D402AF
MLFYQQPGRRGAGAGARPDDAAIADVVKGFEMPGTGQPGFRRMAAEIAGSGIYDLRLHHDRVLMPILRHWRVFERSGLGAEGEAAREDLSAFLPCWTRTQPLRRAPRGARGPEGAQLSPMSSALFDTLSLR